LNIMKKNVPVFDRLTASLIALLLSPIWLVNFLIAFANYVPSTKRLRYVDSYHREHELRHFHFGLLKHSLVIAAVARGDIAWVGASLNDPLTLNELEELKQAPLIPAGLFNIQKLYHNIGLSDKNKVALLRDHSFKFTTSYNFKLLTKCLISHCLFGSARKCNHKNFSLFGIKIYNYSYHEAVNAIVDTCENRCKKGYFLNVNSVNQSFDNPDLSEILNEADHVFCDGSGMRLAAAHAGYKLTANLNGTDLLPLICAAAESNNQSIFLLGGSRGICEKACAQLKTQFPKLQIAGHHHGFFNEDESLHVVNKINSSNADICLVALGTPLQESWIHLHASKLMCHYALAVGGLFDFVAGKFSRAPRWMRELGMEWLWRLVQEPHGKFHRYVIGNPRFLYRTYFQNAALN